MSAPGLSTYNFADIWEAVADVAADRQALVVGDRRLTYGELERRANRLAHVLLSLGVGPGDTVACHLGNSSEYLETLIAAWKIRAVPVNVNYRYTAEELAYLYTDSAAVVGVVDAHLLERVVAIADDLPDLRSVLVVGNSTEVLLPEGAVEVRWFDDATRVAPDHRPEIAGRGDEDRYIIYTGGTTGRPKGVEWRMGDAFFGCLGGGDPMRLSGPVTSPAEMLDRIVDFDFTFYALAPLIHAAAQWVSFMWLFAGARVVLHRGPFDPATVWRTIAEEQVSTTTVVGDAMARPLCDEWERTGPYDTSSLFAFSNGGAPLSSSVRERLQVILPGVVFTDGFGSSETGIQGSSRLEPGTRGAGTAQFDQVVSGTAVLDDDLRPIEPGDDRIGRVAHSGHLPLGYRNDPAKTAETFVEVDGRRYALNGDMARVAEDGSIVLLGRGSISINSGGEKVFPEEVEGVLKSHAAVYDCVVVGVPHERWGEQVTVVVQPVSGERVDLEELTEHAREHLAGYKLPKALVVVEVIERSPTGKADYRWARQVVASAG
ncbi:MAG: acyl-CoA synthetase [Actinobacteria bacterium]|nr:acyl-CoA synthetase [Actinomycetota bacterium]